jgi:hypothetical protein
LTGTREAIMTADIEERGDFYIERKTIMDPAGSIAEYFEAGTIMEIDGERHYKPSADEGYSTRGEAMKWLESMAGKFVPLLRHTHSVVRRRES